MSIQEEPSINKIESEISDEVKNLLYNNEFLNNYTVKVNSNSTKSDNNNNVLNIKLSDKTVTLPTKATNLAAGYDLYCYEDIDLCDVLEKNKDRNLATFKIKTGVHLFFKKVSNDTNDYYIQLYARSSLASQGFFVSGGVIDIDYRGEIIIIMNCDIEVLKNKVNDKTFMKKNYKVAQFVIHKISLPTLKIVDTFDEEIDNERKEKGFGSSNLKKYDDLFLPFEHAKMKTDK